MCELTDKDTNGPGGRGQDSGVTQLCGSLQYISVGTEVRGADKEEDLGREIREIPHHNITEGGRERVCYQSGSGLVPVPMALIISRVPQPFCQLQMLAVPGGGGLGAERDRQVRLHSVSTDLELGLPPSIPLPDGEELPYGSSARIHIRDSQQESEIYQKCIRAPPNRTVLEGESPPPYRSASAGALASPPSDWAVIRSNSVSNRSPPTVQVPAGKRLSALTMVPCLAAPTSTKPKPRSPPLL